MVMRSAPLSDRAREAVACPGCFHCARFCPSTVFLQNNQYLLWPLAAAFGLITIQTLVSGWLAALLAAAGGYYIYMRYQSRIVPPEVAHAVAKEQTAAAVRELGLDAAEFEEDKEAAAKRKAADQEARRAARKAHEAALAAGAALEAAAGNKGSASKAKGKGKGASGGDDVDEDMLVHMASMVKAGSRSAARTIDTSKLLSPSTRSPAASGPASGKGGKDKSGKAAAAAAAAAASESESDAAASAPAPSRSSGGARRRGKGGAAAGDEDGWTQQ